MNRLQSGSNPVIIKPEIVKDITNLPQPLYYCWYSNFSLL